MHTKRRLVAAANEVVANADPRDVEHAAGNGTPYQVEAAREKLGKKALLLSAGSFATGLGAGYAGRHYQDGIMKTGSNLWGKARGLFSQREKGDKGVPTGLGLA